MNWSEVVRHAIRLGPDCFIATVTPRGHPHLAVITPGFLGMRLVFATWNSSVKARNLRAGSTVALHWVVRHETGNDMLMVRGTAELIDDPDRSRELWDADCLPYDLAEWYDGPGDAELLWVEIDPTHASLHRNRGAGGSSVWSEHPSAPDD